MPAVHGKSTKVYANGYDLSTFFKTAGASGEADVPESTTFGASSKAYVAGLLDGTLSAEGLWSNDEVAVDNSDNVLQTALNQQAGFVAYMPAGDVVGNRAFCAEMIEAKYEVTADVADLVAVSAEFQADQGGFEPCVVLHPLASRTTTGNGTAFDYGATPDHQRLFGGTAFLMVGAVTGTTPTLVAKVQHSVDNTTWVDLITFTTASGTGSARTRQRAVTATTTTQVNRYVRATWTLGGTNPNFTFWVGFNRHNHAGA